MSKKKDGSGGNAIIAIACIAVPLILRKVLTDRVDQGRGQEAADRPDGP